MATRVWDEAGTRTFETGVDHGILYVDVAGTATSYTGWDGYPWNGLTGVTESPSGAENNDLWADNIKYLTLTSAEDFGASLTCYTYPDEWKYCDGSVDLDPTQTDMLQASHFALYQQERRKFGLYYRTKVGNDLKGSDHRYKHHIIYGCSATPSERAYSTVNDSPEAIEFSYEISTIPVDPGTLGTGANAKKYKPTSLVTFESNFNPSNDGAKITAGLALIEDDAAKMPSPSALYTAIIGT